MSDTEKPPLYPRDNSRIERAKRGDSEQFLQLVQPYEQCIRATAFSLLRDHHAAEDVAQETLLKAFTRLHQLRDHRHIRNWLLRIAVNEARMHLRKERLRQQPPGKSEDAAEAESESTPRNFQPWHDVPSQILERKELWRRVNEALHCLDPIYREVFVLRDMQHLSTAETAALLRLSEASVTTRLHRARMQLREKLASTFGKPQSEWVPLRMMADMARLMLHRAVSCKTVLRELSNYLDGQVPASLRREIEKHLRLCRRCSILLDSTRKLLVLVGDEKALVPPIRVDRQWRQLVAGLTKRSP